MAMAERKDKGQVTEREAAVVKAAMRFSRDWFYDLSAIKGNRGSLAKLIRACAALHRARGRKG